MSELEKLPYSYNSLEPFIDEETMKIHHDKHHQAYFDKFMNAIQGTEFEGKDVMDVLQNLNKVPESVRTAVKNNGGGHYHHSFFWKILQKDTSFSGPVADAITRKWGTLDAFKEEFKTIALRVFGSGWTWLVVNDKNELEIVNTSNQDSPISVGKKPILAIDVWEHAYYLKYQNKRADYITAFFNIINWNAVNELYQSTQ
ncbi:superoxide dismutase [Candidatus Woesearchaeota archaeon]|jgi:superoxide dismutase, Fe-Mn family|nr:superoxide dismutase [Candidatus Woesearchaeota archaeon]MBT5396865.1 superoxide dismutase [Candidatus Woesearchaeota archaeon]MBT6367615.1 superoxide dismutase [Candidatus Woesearchaeota archaeon]MBT7762363.1 superoxide dismutase [Candidatus Woesearchaeota archaeon]